MIEAYRRGDLAALQRGFIALAVDERAIAQFMAAVAKATDVEPDDEMRRVFERDFVCPFGPTIRRAVGNDAVLIDALRKLTRPYDGPAATLYRGQLVENDGLNWTDSPKVAIYYALKRTVQAAHHRAADDFVVLETMAPPAAIISRPETRNDPADGAEFFIDHRALPAPPKKNDQLSRLVAELKRRGDPFLMSMLER